MQVVVVSHRNRRFGVVVNRIVDIVEERLHVDESRKSRVCAGCVVIDEHVADLIDVDGFVDSQLIRSERMTMEEVAG
jgi:hypothetical protein